MKKVVICAQCGSKMRAGIKFCTKCGYGLRDEQAEALAAAALAEEISANQFTEEDIKKAQKWNFNRLKNTVIRTTLRLKIFSCWKTCF